MLHCLKMMQMERRFCMIAKEEKDIEKASTRNKINITATSRTNSVNQNNLKCTYKTSIHRPNYCNPNGSEQILIQEIYNCVEMVDAHHEDTAKGE